MAEEIRERGPSGVDQAQPIEETITWSDEAREKLEEIAGAGPEFDALLRELQLAGVDDEVLQGFEERFQEILRLTGDAITELTAAIEAAQEAEDFADLLDDDAIEGMEENRRVLRIVSEELTRNKEIVASVLGRREAERTSAEKERLEKERFVRGLNRSGLGARQLFAIIEELDQSKAAEFIGEISGKADTRWSKEVGDAHARYDVALTEIQQEREGLAKKLVHSEKLKRLIASLGLDDDLQENPNEAPKPLVIQLRKSGTYQTALARVRTEYAQELAAFQSQEEPRLHAREIEAAQIRNSDLKNALFGNPGVRGSRYYKMKTEEVTPLLEDGDIPQGDVAQKIAEQILRRRAVGVSGKEAPPMTRREVAFLPKDVLDRVVANFDYETIARTIAADKKKKPAIFWSESFGEKLARMRARYQELSGAHVFDDSAVDDIDTPDSPRAQLFEVYKERDDASIADPKTIKERNNVFRHEIEGIVERLRIVHALQGSSDYNNEFRFGDARFSVASHGFYLSGDHIFPNNDPHYRDNTVNIIRGSDYLDTSKLRKLTPEERLSFQKKEFLEILRKIHQLFNETTRYTLPEENKQETAIRAHLAEKPQRIESDFAHLGEELAVLKQEAGKLFRDLDSLQEETKTLSERTSEDLTNLDAQSARIRDSIRSHEARVKALRGKTSEWGYGWGGNESIEEAAKINSELLAEEKKDWEARIDRTLYYGERDTRDISNPLLESQQRIQRQQEELRRKLIAETQKLRKEKEKREQKIYDIVSSAQEAYRDIHRRVGTKEEAIQRNAGIVGQAQVLMTNIHRALKQNRDVSFGTIFRRRKVVSLCDESGTIVDSREITADEYKRIKTKMEELEAKKETEIQDGQGRIFGFKEELQAMDLDTPYKNAQNSLTDMGFDEESVTQKLKESARLKREALERIRQICS